MFKVVKQSDVYRLLYTSKNFVSGLTDVQAVPYNPSGVAQTAVGLTEVATSGIYYADFSTTSKLVGVWTFKINSTSKFAPAVHRIQIVDANSLNDTPLEGIKNVADLMWSKTQVIDNNILTLDNVADGIQADLNNGTDGLSALKSLIDSVQASVSGIQNNTRVTVALPTLMVIPESGTNIYKIKLNLYDTEGNMENVDDQDPGVEAAGVSVAVTDESGASYDSNLGGLGLSVLGGNKWMLQLGMGIWECTYTVADIHSEKGLLFRFSYSEGGKIRTVDRATRTSTEDRNVLGQLTTVEGKVDTIDSVVDTIGIIVAHASYGNAAIKVLIDAIQSDLANGTDGLGALRTLIDSVLAAVNTSGSQLNAIKGSGWVTEDNLHNIHDQVQAGGLAI